MEEKHPRRDARTGAAVTETALLCFFLYVPILMMVLVWGDLTLDRERAQSAAAYMAFDPIAVRERELRQRFFPGATGSPDATRSVRDAGVERDRAIAPPPYTAEGPGAPLERRDVQQMLFAMAMGEISSSLEWVDAPGGGYELRPVVTTSRDEVARYLIRNEIVEDFSLPDRISVEPGEEVDLITGTSAARSPTEYARAVRRILNGSWEPMGEDDPPLLLSDIRFWTTYRSPYYDELAEYRYGGRSYRFDVPTIQGRPGLRMEFGTRVTLAEEPGSPFTTGYTYLFNPGAVRSPERIRGDLRRLSGRLFGFEGQDRRMDGMETPVGTVGQTPANQYPMPFLRPGDARQHD